MRRDQLNKEAERAGVKAPERLPNKAAVEAAIEDALGGLPCSSLREATPYLRRPFAPNAVKWKIQVNPKDANSAAMIVAYIDARLVAARLDAVVPGLWSNRFESVDGGIVCHLTIDGVTRCDVGWSRGRGDNMGLKTVYSDALKRAGVQFGIAASLYSLPRSYVKGNELQQRSGKDGPVFYLTASAERKLREGYEKWLHSDHPFGAFLDHGDPEDSQGDVETESVEVPASDVPAFDAEADLTARSKLLQLCAQVQELGVWTRPQTKARFVEAGAVDNSSAGAAIQTMSTEQVTAMVDTVEAAIAEKTNGSVKA